MSKKIQIDLLPLKNVNSNKIKSYKMNTYFNGYCYTSYTFLYEANRMFENGLVSQFKGQKYNPKGEIVYFDYEDNIDSARVKFTSQVFKVI